MTSGHYPQDRKQLDRSVAAMNNLGKKNTSEDLPPSYSSIPPDITTAFSNLRLGQSASIPTADECIAHLKLLEAFSLLREDVGTTDGLYGIRDDLIEPSAFKTEQEAAELLAAMREKRWAIYVTNAVQRFEIYWKVCIQADARMLAQVDMDSENIKDIADRGTPLTFTTDTLPPLDLIMVWHAYMLNPRSFFADCMRSGKMRFWQAGLPWEAINSAIDSNTFEYNPGPKAMKSFTAQTLRRWNNLDEDTLVALSCPKCRGEVAAPLTTCNNKDSWTNQNSGKVGTGYADKGFQARCKHCSCPLDHNALRSQKFRADLQKLLARDCPMPGTFLTIDGLPERPQRGLPQSAWCVTFPNRLIKAGLSSKLLDITDMKWHGSEKPRSMEDVRDIIEAGLGNPDILKKAGETQRRRQLTRDERIAIRRMMAAYWDNSSTFGIDLVGAVVRQCVFVEKMHSIDWVHSPAVSSTMMRLITKYQRYFQILAAYPNEVAVPTLDVDLAWHTHQLSPRSYLRYSVAKTRKFIDHDDKIEENKLSLAFEWTSKTYQKMFDSVYSECTCWYCEAVREGHTSTVSRIFKSSKNPVAKELDALYDSTAKGCDADKMPHISAHNAIRPIIDKEDRSRMSVREAELERNYQRACQRARKKGREPPTRDMSCTYWGYPMTMPYYAPYTTYYPYVGGMALVVVVSLRGHVLEELPEVVQAALQVVPAAEEEGSVVEAAAEEEGVHVAAVEVAVDVVAEEGDAGAEAADNLCKFLACLYGETEYLIGLEHVGSFYTLFGAFQQ
ncbi:hypothetical protein MMC27_008086 [Xylographa pallens]|nr:hypothetical protein [Xylographa pallens]